MKMIEERGDLFDVDFTRYVVAHCISADVNAKFGLNAGIAKTFRQTYPDMANAIYPYLRIGTSVRYVAPSGHVIYNLVTKPTIYHKCRGSYAHTYMNNLASSLHELRDMMIDHNETCIAMPRIACGRDHAKWRDVATLIHTVFDDTPFTVLVRSLI